MARIQDSIDIRAPIDQVFQAITDPRRTIEWNPAIIEVTDIAGLPPQVGTSWRQVAQYMGRTATLLCRIVELNPPYEGVLQVTGDYEGRISTICDTVDGVTRVVEAIDFTPPGGLAGKMAMAVVQPAIRREVAQTLARQREVLEREADPVHGVPGSKADGSRTA